MPADTEFTEFAAARSGPMFRTAWLLTGDWHLAEDLVQESLGKIYRKWRGLPIYLQWSRSVDHSQSVPHDELSVIYENEDGDVVRVMLSVSDDPDLSTPERRAEIVAWIEQQIDAMIAAATADDATTR